MIRLNVISFIKWRGRTHPALVKGVNKKNKSVTVEWLEGDETKGKEIDLESILALNSNLAPSKIANPSIMGNERSRIGMISPVMSSSEHSLSTLRYADRVKGLRVVDLAENERQGSSNQDNGEENDVPMLRNANDRELPLELSSNYEALPQLPELEREVFDMHKTFCENDEAIQYRSEKLLRVARDVNYDKKAYLEELKELIKQKKVNAIQWQGLGVKVDNLQKILQRKNH